MRFAQATPQTNKHTPAKPTSMLAHDRERKARRRPMTTMVNPAPNIHNADTNNTGSKESPHSTESSKAVQPSLVQVVRTMSLPPPQAARVRRQ